MQRCCQALTARMDCMLSLLCLLPGTRDGAIEQAVSAQGPVSIPNAALLPGTHHAMAPASQ
jgi:hypothetical protein